MTPTDTGNPKLKPGQGATRVYRRLREDILRLNIAAVEDRQEDAAERLAHLHSMQVSERFLRYLSRRESAELSVVPPV